MELWIGASGYVYPEWTGVLYPRGTPSAKMLGIYAESFPLVELNFSYYQMPTANQLARMARQVAPAFQFIVKAHRSLTHDANDEHLTAFADSLKPLRQSGQLANVLCQFPQRFHRSSTNCQWVATIQEGLGGAPVAVEFRHESWDHPDVNAWLREKNIILVSVDVPDSLPLYPRKLVQTGPHIYVRLHSRRAASWYGPGAERYDYVYSDEELREWTDALAQRAGEAKRALMLFNNCRRASAVINARRVAFLLSRQPHPFNVIGPIAPAVPQGLLFD